MRYSFEGFGRESLQGGGEGSEEIGAGGGTGEKKGAGVKSRVDGRSQTCKLCRLKKLEYQKKERNRGNRKKECDKMEQRSRIVWQKRRKCTKRTVWNVNMTNRPTRNGSGRI